MSVSSTLRSDIRIGDDYMLGWGHTKSMLDTCVNSVLKALIRFCLTQSFFEIHGMLKHSNLFHKYKKIVGLWSCSLVLVRYSSIILGVPSYGMSTYYTSIKGDYFLLPN